MEDKRGTWGPSAHGAGESWRGRLGLSQACLQSHLSSASPPVRHHPRGQEGGGQRLWAGGAVPGKEAPSHTLRPGAKSSAASVGSLLRGVGWTPRAPGPQPRRQRTVARHPLGSGQRNSCGSCLSPPPQGLAPPPGMPGAGRWPLLPHAERLLSDLACGAAWHPGPCPVPPGGTAGETEVTGGWDAPRLHSQIWGRWEAPALSPAPKALWTGQDAEPQPLRPSV